MTKYAAHPAPIRTNVTPFPAMLALLQVKAREPILVFARDNMKSDVTMSFGLYNAMSNLHDPYSMVIRLDDVTTKCSAPHFRMAAANHAPGCRLHRRLTPAGQDTVTSCR